MDHTGGWKASQYQPRLGAIILERLAQGDTIKQICADPDMPSQATLHRWRHMHPDFWAGYERMAAERAAWRRQWVQEKRKQRREWALMEAKLGRRRTRTWVSGRKSTYDLGRARVFCERVASGKAVHLICQEPGMPSSKAVYSWLQREPEFVAMYVEAKGRAIRGLQIRVWSVVDGTLDGLPSPEAFRAARAKVARLEGRMGRIMPKTYR
jgi:hypothetical protein